jgi:restriction endonuclease S subunit
MVKFGDVVKLNTDRIADPAAAGIERYVGLEHIEPEDLRIRRWGLVAEGTTFTNYFKPGQTLFGKRRAYQRKVAVADFEGVCSGDIYVFEPKDNCLLPELLPFICQTERFYEYAVGTSAGSLSPRTNWTQLAQYEIAHPTLAEQRRMAKALWATENVLENLRVASDMLARLKTVVVEDAISNIHRIVSFGDLLSDVSYGSSTRASYDEDGVPILRIPNVLREEIDLNDLKWVKLTQEEIERYSVRDGDILIVRTNGNPEYVGRCVVAHNQPKPMTYASYLIRLRVKQEIANADYIATILNSLTLRQQIRGSVRSSAGNYNINTEGIRRQQIPLPELVKQEELMEQLSLLSISQDSIDTRYNATHQLKEQLLSELGG